MVVPGPGPVIGETFLTLAPRSHIQPSIFEKCPCIPSPRVLNQRAYKIEQRRIFTFSTHTTEGLLTGGAPFSQFTYWSPGTAQAHNVPPARVSPPRHECQE